MTPEPQIHDPTPCELGEGPLWHPVREQLFWFDILRKQLLTREAGATRHWQFDAHVSAAGWIDRDRLMIASERALLAFDLRDGTQQVIAPLDVESAQTRSNDGRADPMGGFWIGTMGKRAEPGAGAIWRWHRGEVRRLFAPLTIPNAICFTPDGRSACFADTPARRILRVPLDRDGWPAGDPETFIDLRADGLNPDGAVFDASGHLWNAQWGASRVAVYDPDGGLVNACRLPVRNASCPAFGGAALDTLFITTAREHLDDPGALDGATFAIPNLVRGQAEHQVTL